MSKSPKPKRRTDKQFGVTLSPRTATAEQAKKRLEKFVHGAPRAYGKTLTQQLGPAQSVTREGLQWWTRDGRTPVLIELKDEFIPHDFPQAHHDFVYTTAEIPLTPRQASYLPYVTGSISVDLLKDLVTARCGDLFANSITLGFVNDLANDKLSLDKQALKREYGRRIKQGILTPRFQLK